MRPQHSRRCFEQVCKCFGPVFPSGWRHRGRRPTRRTSTCRASMASKASFRLAATLVASAGGCAAPGWSQLDGGLPFITAILLFVLMQPMHLVCIGTIEPFSTFGTVIPNLCGPGGLRFSTVFHVCFKLLTLQVGLSVQVIALARNPFTADWTLNLSFLGFERT